MKKPYGKKSILFAATFFGAVAFAGNGGGSHGGDTLVFEFSGTAQNLARALEKTGPIEGCPNAKAFASLVDGPQTHYSSAVLVTVPFENQQTEVDARNWNDAEGHHIEISRVRVSQIKDPELLVTLVLHEFLGLMGTEGTNDRRFSQKCLDGLRALGKPEFDPKALAYHIDPISTIERSFIEGKLLFQCASGGKAAFDGDLRLVMQKKSFCAPGATAIALESRGNAGQWETLGRSGCLDPSEREKLFFVQYSIQTGEGRYALNPPNMRQVGAISFSSPDRADWVLQAAWTSREGSGKFSGTCSPSLVVQ